MCGYDDGTAVEYLFCSGSTLEKKSNKTRWVVRYCIFGDGKNRVHSAVNFSFFNFSMWEKRCVFVERQKLITSEISGRVSNRVESFHQKYFQKIIQNSQKLHNVHEHDVIKQIRHIHRIFKNLEYYLLYNNQPWIIWIIFFI